MAQKNSNSKKLRFCHSISSYSKLKSKGDDVIPIDSHMKNEEYHTSNFKFKPPISKLQKKCRKKNSKKILSATFHIF